MEGMKKALPSISIQAFNNHLPRSGGNFFMALMSAPSFNAYRIRSKQFETMIKWSAEAADIVLVDHLEIFDQIPEKLGKPIAYHSHNAEHVLWEELAKLKGTFFSKWIYDWEASRVKVLERYAVRKSNITFAAPNDKEKLLTIQGLEESMFRNTYHLGNDELLELPTIDLATNGKKVFYAGTLSWEPNRDGLHWFLLEVWPKVLENDPDAEFHVCGKGADEDLSRLMQQRNGVTYHSFVDDLETVMNQCRCAVVPLRMGSGMKIKTFDALYRGLPLITTSIGAEGIVIENKTHAFVVDASIKFAEAVNQALNDTDSTTILRDSARHLCQEMYRYPELLHHMEDDIRALL